MKKVCVKCTLLFEDPSSRLSTLRYSSFPTIIELRYCSFRSCHARLADILVGIEEPLQKLVHHRLACIPTKKLLDFYNN